MRMTAESASVVAATAFAASHAHTSPKNIFDRFCFAFLLYSHSHKDTRIYFGLRFLSETVEQASPFRSRSRSRIRTRHPLAACICIREAALIGADGVIYINVCHFSSFALFAFHFFGSLNCRRRVIYWPYWPDSPACPRRGRPRPGRVWSRLQLTLLWIFSVFVVFSWIVIFCSQNFELNLARFKVKSDVKENWGIV